MKASEYNKLNELLAEYSRLNAAFEAAEAEIKTIQLAAAAELLPKHAELKVKTTDLEAKLRDFADNFYDELFPDEKRTHKTPFGGLAYKKTSSLDAPDEEKSILLIKLACAQEDARAKALKESPRFTVAQLIRTREELNREALELLDDITLAAFAVRREHKDNFKIQPFAMHSDKPARKAKSLAEAA